MTADLVEQAELKTGRRSEGVFFSSVTFVRKTVQGIGLMAASVVLALAEFPSGADVSQVSDEAIWILSLWLGMIAVISGYKLNEDIHQDNLKQLQKKRLST